MKRLTVKRPDGRWAIANNDNANPMEQMLKIPLVIDRLAAYEDTGLEPDRIREFMAKWVKIAELAEFMKSEGIEHLRDLIQAEQAGRLVVLDEETALALAAVVHGCNTNKRLVGASYMRHIHSENTKTISYYRAIEVLAEIAERALEGANGDG